MSSCGIRKGVALLLGAFMSATSAFGAESVVLQLKWRHQFQFAGYYAAVEKGYYAEADLEVTFMELSERANAVQSLVSGKADYVVTDASLPADLASGRRVVALAATFQHSPLAFLVLESSGIRSFRDLRGKKLMIGSGRDRASLIAALRRSGLQSGDYELFPWSNNVEMLGTGEIDAFPAYLTDDFSYQQSLGQPTRFLHPSSTGINFYGDVLATTEQEQLARPDRVERFREASLKGWRYAVENPDEIIEVILSDYNSQGLSKQQLRAEAEATIDLIQPMIFELGYMSRKRWRNIEDTYLDVGLIDSRVNVEDSLIYAAEEELSLNEGLARYGISLLIFGGAFLLLTVSLFLYQTRRIVRDRTRELRRRSAELQNLIDTVPGSVATMDRGYNLLSMNEYGINMFERQIDDWATIKTREFVHADDINAYREFVSKVFVEGEGRLTYRALDPRGEILWIESYGTLLQSSTKRAPVGLFLAFNVTGRKNQEDVNRELQDVVEKQDKLSLIGQISGGIAHDFNNVLAIISGNAELLAEYSRQRNEDVPRQLDTIIEVSDQATELIRGLLQFARTEEVQDVVINLNDEVETIVSVLRSTMPSTVSIRLETSTNPLAIELNRVQLQQLLLNLSVNAGHAMEQAGVLHIETRCVTSDQTCAICGDSLAGADWIELSVVDDGHGMDQALIDKVFQPFYSTKSVAEGTGLGLAVVKGIMSRGGRHIVVESKPASGSAFRLYFPSVEGVPIVEPEKPRVEEHVATEATIMVVDDEERVADMIGSAAKSAGHRVVIFNDSKEALAYFEEHSAEIDLVLTDQLMPVMTGLELASELKSIKPGLPVVLCSGYIGSDQEEMGSVDGFVSKPFHIKELIAEFSRLLAVADD